VTLAHARAIGDDDGKTEGEGAGNHHQHLKAGKQYAAGPVGGLPGANRRAVGPRHLAERHEQAEHQRDGGGVERKVP